MFCLFQVPLALFRWLRPFFHPSRQSLHMITSDARFPDVRKEPDVFGMGTFLGRQGLRTAEIPLLAFRDR